MTRQSNPLMIVAILAASFAGGACYQWAFGSRPVHAQRDVPQELRAHAVAIVDQAGNDRARLGVSEDGRAALLITDEADTLRLIVGQSAAGGAGVQIFDRAGDWRCGFAHGPAGAGVNLTSQNDTVSLGVNVGPDGATGGMYFTNAQGTKVFGLGTGPGGTGLDLLDSNGAVRANIGMRDDGAPAFRLLDGDGVTRAAMAVDANGLGSIAVADDTGQDIWRVE